MASSAPIAATPALPKLSLLQQCRLLQAPQAPLVTHTRKQGKFFPLGQPQLIDKQPGLHGARELALDFSQAQKEALELDHVIPDRLLGLPPETAKQVAHNLRHLTQPSVNLVCTT